MGLKQNLENIQTNLTNAKTAIAQSISNKGVECSADDALSTYASKIDSISGGTSGKFVVPDGMKFAKSTFKTLDVSNWDVSNVYDMSYMFASANTLTSLDLSNFDTSKVTNMCQMFSQCSNLRLLDLSNWNTSNVTDMNNMFSYSSGLTSLDLSNWNTSKVTDINYMFSNCSGLTNLDLSSFNTSYVTNMGSMFYNCKALTDLKFNDIGHKDLTLTLDLTSCSALTKESVLFLFEHAFDRTTAGYRYPFIIKLHADTKALLTEDEIAIATNKGFTVV